MWPKLLVQYGNPTSDAKQAVLKWTIASMFTLLRDPCPEPETIPKMAL